MGAEEQAASQEHSGEEVVINFDGSVDAVNSSLCVDTSAFVGVTVTFIMILVVALITIVFLWMRIKSLDTKTKQTGLVDFRWCGMYIVRCAIVLCVYM